MIELPHETDDCKRGELLAKLLDHCERVPDAQEVFGLLDTLRQLDAITPDESSMLMHLYWEGQ